MNHLKIMKKIAAIFVVGLFLANTVSAAIFPDPMHNTIAVEGMGKVEVTPDKAFVKIGVQSQDPILKKALDDNKSHMKTLTESLQKDGVLSTEMETQNYFINPRYEYKDGKSTLKGYMVSNTVIVTVNKIDDLSTIIDDASQSGANMIQDVVFGLKNPAEYYNKALKEALAKAKEKAILIAKSMGVTLKQAIMVREQHPMMEHGFGGPGPMPFMRVGAVGGIANKTEMGDGFGSISKGLKDIKAFVSVIYKY